MHWLGSVRPIREVGVGRSGGSTQAGSYPSKGASIPPETEREVPTSLDWGFEFLNMFFQTLGL